MYKKALKSIVKAIKEIDIAMWQFDTDSPMFKKLKVSRNELFSALNDEGFILTTEYKLIEGEVK